MRGNNELILNEATVIEAIQEYLDRRTVPTARVTVESVAKHSHGAGFVSVKLSEPKAKEATDGQ